MNKTVCQQKRSFPPNAGMTYFFEQEQPPCILLPILHNLIGMGTHIYHNRNIVALLKRLERLLGILR
jgi:hypothetical protein